MQFFTSLTTKKAILLLIIVGALVYCNALFNGFVWDDGAFIVNNVQVHQFNLAVLFGPNLFNDGPFFRPLPAVYFAALYSLFGQQAFFYHFLQITLHIISTILLYLFLASVLKPLGGDKKEMLASEWDKLSGSQHRKLQRKYGHIELISDFVKDQINVVALFLALVFLVHPINVESVSFIGATQSELYFIPGILALYLSRLKKISTTRFLVISGLLFVRCLTKETGFLFIPLLILFRYLFIEKKILPYLLSAVGITALYACIRYFIGRVTYQQNIATVPIAALSLSQRALNMPAIFLYYIKTVLYPIPLAVEQFWTIKTFTVSDVLLPLILCLLVLNVIAYGGYRIYIQDKQQFMKFLFFALWFFIGMGLLMQIVPLDNTVSDRWFYFPFVGLLGMVGISIQHFIPQGKWMRRAGGVGLIMLVLLAVRTMVRNTNYASDLVLVSHDSNVRDNFSIEENIAADLLKEKIYPLALTHYLKSVAMHPTLSNLEGVANVYEVTGNPKAARPYIFQLIDTYNDNTPVNYNGALVYGSAQLLYYDSPVYAKQFMMQALPKASNSPDLWANFAISLYRLNDQKDALRALQYAYKLYPDTRMAEIYTRILQMKPFPSYWIFVPNFIGVSHLQ